MMSKVRLTDTEKWRLVTERLTRVLTVGFWSRNISNREERQDRPRKETERFVKSHQVLPAQLLPSQPASL